MIEAKMLELSDARAVVEAAKQEVAANGWKTSVSIVDPGGHPLLFERTDGAAPATARVAFEKARTAAIFRGPIGGREDRVADRPAMPVLPGATPLKRGVPLLAAGQGVRATGASRLLPQQDHQAAQGKRPDLPL